MSVFHFWLKAYHIDDEAKKHWLTGVERHDGKVVALHSDMEADAKVFEAFVDSPKREMIFEHVIMHLAGELSLESRLTHRDASQLRELISNHYTINVARHDPLHP